VSCNSSMAKPGGRIATVVDTCMTYEQGIVLSLCVYVCAGVLLSHLNHNLRVNPGAITTNITSHPVSHALVQFGQRAEHSSHSAALVQLLTCLLPTHIHKQVVLPSDSDPYPFGVDPTWRGTKTELPALNRYVVVAHDGRRLLNLAIPSIRISRSSINPIPSQPVLYCAVRIGRLSVPWLLAA
jgi:hypothetical protein